MNAGASATFERTNESAYFLLAQRRLVEHLNHDPIRVGAIKRRAAVTVNLERMDNFYRLRNELLLDFPHRSMLSTTKPKWSSWLSVVLPLKC